MCIAGAVALAGCSSGSSKTDAQELGPLDQYWAALSDGQDWDQTAFEKQEQETQALIAQCMAKEGFEYKPNTVGSGMVTFGGDDEEVDWQSLEFAEQYGYGVINWPGMDNDAFEDGVMETDPNEEYINSLTDSEQEAYWETLYGAQLIEEEVILGEEEIAADYEYNWEDNGCWGWADHQVAGDSMSGQAGLWDDPEFTEMLDAMMQMWEDTSVSSATDSLDLEWSACMADGGYDGLIHRDDARNQIFEDYDQLLSSSNNAEPDQEAQDELHAREIALAVADWKCSDKVGYDKQLRDVDIEAQKEFVAKYKDELEAMVAKYARTNDS